MERPKGLTLIIFAEVLYAVSAFLNFFSFFLILILYIISDKNNPYLSFENIGTAIIIFTLGVLAVIGAKDAWELKKTRIIYLSWYKYVRIC
ncbi:hypothetical protein COX95_00295 [bacterium CG_4_10_14_0_2_um_filter_33_32]|nr:MAG: hypothetical protein AUJ93_03365 [bacterium CG2_30_33_46]PIR67469.1 MAG: hypothetical protein COU50_03110 [bacterium CG10_big_fil_rev_8_21_14_0_10_33_18]PIU76553.1 MAG: hypothetical protein COS74_03430 [bacterium CG06_land_8_20_14_3_00_33_50]PIW81693.1 MAG: hypothetical protein COZ97_00330 [bacterium CG_4_8_14_3_um_filter_33_28]PIZ86677.1 MAG: hypothetical protein COX95_00295 [bacterium CG_4_10_14_0_2_um_filter_33_32]PJA71731.1 MAG: hypothetical protein CO152_05145 [bacterium CG_4_9_14